MTRISHDIRGNRSIKCSFCGDNTLVGGIYQGNQKIVICENCVETGAGIGILLGDAIADILPKQCDVSYGREMIGNRIDNIIKCTKDVLIHALLQDRARGKQPFDFLDDNHNDEDTPTPHTS